MSRLYELLVELCPNGVEYKKVKDVLISLKTGLNPRQNFKLNGDGAKQPYITGKDIFDNHIVVSERTDLVTIEAVELINKRACLENDDLLFLSTGTGTVGRMALINEYDGTWSISESIYALKVKKDIILSKYLMYFLYTEQAVMQYKPFITKASVPHLRVADLMKVKLPVPPLEVQCEIVRVLDYFTLLTDELSYELTARKKQYEYYRNQLIDNDTYPLVRLGDVATIIRGGNFQKKHFVENGKPCIHYGQMYTHFGISADKVIRNISEEVYIKSKIASKNDVVMAVTSENVEDVCSCTAWLGDEDIAVSGHTAIIKHNQNAKYLSYYFHTNHFFVQKAKLAHGTKVIEVTPSALNDILIPLPSVEEQERIVSVLDRFDKLCHDIATGIPAEIESRRKQYEYYRNRLFSF